MLNKKSTAGEKYQAIDGDRAFALGSQEPVTFLKYFHIEVDFEVVVC